LIIFDDLNKIASTLIMDDCSVQLM